MEYEVPAKELSDSDFYQRNKISDYHDLVIRLKDIKKSINLLENNFFTR